MKSFADLGLSLPFLNALTDLGFQTPTPIQEKAIPPLLTGKDLLGAAQTGTGKTAAFSLPILERLLPFANSSLSPAKHPVRFLVLTPTRELALQVFDSIKSFTPYTLFKSLCVFGGVTIDSQKEALNKGVDVLIATPGRLLDFIEQGLHLNAVEALVLDEADRMLDMGFLPSVSRILNELPQKRQNLLFSATFSKEIKALAARLLNDPLTIEIAPKEQINKNIAHLLYVVESRHKKNVLAHLLNTEILGQALVFVKTKQGAHDLKRELCQKGVVAEAIHGDRSQTERLAVFEAFKNKSVRVLVATDVAARGLDVDDLPCVINFELPTTPQDYVHRIGRTGRAGKKGLALSLFSQEEEPFLKEIERLIQAPIQQKKAPSILRRTSPKKPAIAEDGFCFDAPYTPQTASRPPSSPVLKEEKPLAVLLGGLGR